VQQEERGCIRHARLAIKMSIPSTLAVRYLVTAESARRGCASASATGGMATDCEPTMTSIEIARYQPLNGRGFCGGSVETTPVM
jgi:hypothetical protein